MIPMRTATWPLKDGSSAQFEMVDGVARDILENKSSMKNNFDMGTHKITGLSDAKEDGDALALAFAKTLFAPRGYGYGEPCISFSHTGDASVSEFEKALDEVVAGMQNKTAKQICFVCSGIIASTTFYGTIYRHTANNVIVTGTTYMQNSSIIKTKVSGKWNPHEWLNPPMELGKEYRTTERWNGEVVYTRLINSGSAVNKKLMYWPESVSLHRIHAEIGENILPYDDGTDYARISGGTQSYMLLCSSTFSGQTVYVQYWYTK